MKPVYQRIRVGPGQDCFESCLASLLELRREDVPSFCNGPEWITQAQQWLKQFGLGLAVMRGLTAESLPMLPEGFFIAGGEASGRMPHAAIYEAKRTPGGGLDFLLQHDPFLSPAFIEAHREALATTDWFPGLRGDYRDWIAFWLVATAPCRQAARAAPIEAKT